MLCVLLPGTCSSGEEPLPATLLTQGKAQPLHKVVIVGPQRTNDGHSPVGEKNIDVVVSALRCAMR